MPAGRVVTPASASVATAAVSPAAAATPSTLTSTAAVSGPISISSSEVQISQRSGGTNAPLQPTAAERADQQPRQSVSGQQAPPPRAEAARVEAQVRAEQEALQRQEIRQLAEVDREVRAHEAAHAAAGGQHAGAPTYEFTRGPDGRLYAVAGEVSIDTGPVPNDLQATIEKAQTILRAATAPANPSPQDLRVAAEAQAMLVEAQAQLALEQQQSEEADPVTTTQETAASEGDSSSESGASGTGLLASSVSDSNAENNRLATEPQTAPADAVNERLERAREQRENFAEQLQDFNRVQQQLIDSGVIDGFSEPGSFIDIQA